LPLLRKIIGLTQSQLAQLIGVSLITIKKIERGENKLTEEIIRRLFSTTGVMPSSVRKNDGKLYRIGGVETYRREHFELWRNRIFPVSEMEAWKAFEGIICPHMLLLLLAAAKPAMGGKVKTRLSGLLESWTEWEKRVVKSFGLYPQIKTILHQFPVKQTKEVAYFAFLPGLYPMPGVFKLLKEQKQSGKNPEYVI